MNEMLNAMIAMQQQALTLQRRQIDVAPRMMAVGQDMVAAQQKSAEALHAGQKAWSGWLSLWGAK